jgi:opacity protein-like surface antigen
MKKSFIVVALTLGFAASANADWNVAAGYTNIADSDDGFDISLNAITAGVGYEIEFADSQFSVMPEFRIGFGVDDDDKDGIKLEIERYMAVSVRGVYHASDAIYLYAQPSYANLKIKGTGFGQTATDDEWEFGVGAGIGVNATEQLSFELSYENFDDTDFITAGIRYAF